MSTPSPEALAAAKEIEAAHQFGRMEPRRTLERAAIIDRHFERIRNSYALAASIDREFTTLAGRLDQLCCDLNPNKESGCGDCDPCLGGRPDQCAIDPAKR